MMQEEIKSMLKRAMAIIESQIQGQFYVHYWSVWNALSESAKQCVGSQNENNEIEVRVLLFDAQQALAEANATDIAGLENKLNHPNLTIEEVREIFARGMNA